MPVNENYLDHLQGVITRDNSNSFMIKGWTITICTAIFALAGTWGQPTLALIALVPISVFWVLDSFYLANERCFVSLYNAAINDYSLTVKNKQLLSKHRVKSDPDDSNSNIDPEQEVVIKTSPYSMNFTLFQKVLRNNWYAVIVSRTIIWFYLMLTCFSLALFAGLLFFNKPPIDQSLKVSAKIETDSLLFKTKAQHIIENRTVLNDSVAQKDSIRKGKK